MPLTAEEQKIVDKHREVNRGDVALGRNPNQQRTQKQRLALRSNIEPGDLFNRHRPNDNFQFAWCPLKDDDFYYDLREEGYKPVLSSEWILNRDGWDWRDTPQSDRWRFGTDNVLRNRDEVLFYRNETLYEQEKVNRLAFSENNISARQDTAMVAAERAAFEKGIEVDLEVNGKPNKAGVRRTMSI